MVQAQLCSPTQARPGTGQMGDADFAAICAMLRASAGIAMGPSKRELVMGRLSRRLRSLGLQDFSHYLDLLEGPGGDAELGEMINALTTNLTGFFREPHHFTFLADTILAERLQAGAERRLRIWSAACSSGQEPYSIAMVLHKALAGRGLWDARILATDIDTNMIAASRAGIYDAESAASIPQRYRQLCVRGDGGEVAMSDETRRLITFNPLNLLDEWPMQGRFDVVFCRNVVIYFDKDIQRVLFDRIADILNPGGWLFIGHSESLLNVTDRFENTGRTIYRKLR